MSKQQEDEFAKRYEAYIRKLVDSARRWRYFIHSDTEVMMKATKQPEGTGWVEISASSYERILEERRSND